jgi:catechol 2,3-dioxygenase-like lactoylglutathione lyase family enzyme
MKRFHVHVSVDDIETSVRFYSNVFGAPPTVRKDDYAKWMVEDPRVNFAISKRGAKPGLDHLGLQVDSDLELAALRTQVEKAEIEALDQSGAACCYARSDKYWITDPQGIAWETFHTLDSIPVFGETVREAAVSRETPCCAREKTGEASPARSGACCT